jgi:hypothetical protein
MVRFIGGPWDGVVGKRSALIASADIPAPAGLGAVYARTRANSSKHAAKRAAPRGSDATRSR